MRLFTAACLDEFLVDGATFAVKSSNVAMASYEAESQTLFITYKGGRIQAYQVTPAMARAFITAPSHGVWLWDNVRVRGTVHEHQVPTYRVS